MKGFTVYDSASGRILRTGNCQDETFAAQAMSSGEAVIEDAGAWATQYVLAGEFMARPPSSVSLSQSGASIALSGVNSGIRPQVVDVTGNATSLDAAVDGAPVSATLPSGTYAVLVDQFPELSFSQQITIP